jgi:hypothetical protein
MAMVTKREMVTSMRVTDNEEGNGDGGESNGTGDTGGKHVTATRVMTTAMATRGR